MVVACLEFCCMDWGSCSSSLFPLQIQQKIEMAGVSWGMIVKSEA